jgi:hypothetical protein
VFNATFNNISIICASWKSVSLMRGGDWSMYLQCKPFTCIWFYPTRRKKLHTKQKNTQKNQPNHNIQLLIVYFIKISHIFHNSFIMWTIWFIKYIILNLNPINIMRSLIFLFFYNLIISATASNTRCSHLDFCQYKCIYIHVGYSGACTCICLLCLTMNMCSSVYMLFT